MKKFLLILTFVSFAYFSEAKNPIVNPFGPYKFGVTNFPNSNKDFIKFQELCNKDKYSAKDVNKVRQTYDQLISKDPDTKVAAMCYLGYYYQLAGNDSEKMLQDGFSLLTQGLKLLPDTNTISGKQRLELKSLICSVYNQLGYAYLKGLGTSQNDDLAFAAYCKACEYRLSSRTVPFGPLGLCFILGIGTSADADSAAKYLDDCSPQWYTTNQIYADFESLKYMSLWSQENIEDSIMFNTFKDGYVKWHIAENYGEARDAFMKAINMGFLPAMCEYAMMNLDVKWNDRNEDDFEKYLQMATDYGYPPASYIMGRRYLEHWGVSVPFSSSGEGKAYPYFVASAKTGYKPSIEILKQYDEGKYSTKTGLAAAFHDLNEGFKGGDENSPGVLEGLLDIYSAAKVKVSHPSGCSASSNRSSQGNGYNNVDQFSGGSNTSSGSGTTTNSSSNRSSSSSNKTSSASGVNSKSTTSKSTSSSNKSTGATTRNCRKCGGAGKVTCSRCKGNTRTKCAGCDGRGYNTVVGAGKRKCSICDGKGTTRCTHCNGSGKEKCLACNGKGQVRN